MAIDPEVIPASNTEGNNSVTVLPKWVIYITVAFLVFLLISLLRKLFLLIVMAFLLTLIWNQAKKTNSNSD